MCCNILLPESFALNLGWKKTQTKSYPITLENHFLFFQLFETIKHFQILKDKEVAFQGRGGGLVVSVLDFCYDDLSLNHAD